MGLHCKEHLPQATCTPRDIRTSLANHRQHSFQPYRRGLWTTLTFNSEFAPDKSPSPHQKGSLPSIIHRCTTGCWWQTLFSHNHHGSAGSIGDKFWACEPRNDTSSRQSSELFEGMIGLEASSYQKEPLNLRGWIIDGLGCKWSKGAKVPCDTLRPCNHFLLWCVWCSFQDGAFVPQGNG